MDKPLLKRALKQTFASEDDEETDKVLDTLATNLLKNLHKEKSHVNIVVAEAFRSGGINALEALYQRILADNRTTFKQQELKRLINKEVKQLK